MCFYLPAGNMTATAGNYMSVAVNSFFTPFNSGYPINTAANTYSMHGAYVQGYSGTTQSVGYTELVALYSLYKVKKWKLTVKPQCATAADEFHVVVVSIGNEQIPSASATYVNVSVLSSQPRAKTGQCIFSHLNKLSLAEHVHTTLGKRREQWLAIDGVPLTGAPATNDIAYAGIFFQAMNGSANQANVSIQITLDQEVEFTDLIAQIT
jgi:hypothetical protein